MNNMVRSRNTRALTREKGDMFDYCNDLGQLICYGMKISG